MGSLVDETFGTPMHAVKRKIQLEMAEKRGSQALLDHKDLIAKKAMTEKKDEENFRRMFMQQQKKDKDKMHKEEADRDKADKKMQAYLREQTKNEK